MIESFLDSWELFKFGWLSGWLIGVVLALTGVVIVARDQIFLGAAIAQASTLGIAAAIGLGTLAGESLGAWVHDERFAAAAAVLFSVGAAVLTARGGGRGQESHEAITGWVFLFSASVSILLVASSAHGLELIHKLLFSTIISATLVDVVIFAALLAATVAFLAARARPLVLLVMDPAMAAAVGMRTRRWSLALSAWLGLVVGLSLDTSGLLYTFGSLVLPPLIAKAVCREVRPMFAVAGIVAALAGVGGFALAHVRDLPPAQMTVALEATALAAVWALRGAMPALALRRRRPSPPAPGRRGHRGSE